MKIAAYELEIVSKKKRKRDTGNYYLPYGAVKR